MSAPIRVLIADDHPVVRAGLASMLHNEPDLEVVGEAQDGASAIELAKLHRADIVLMDLQMPSLDGAGATARLRTELPEAKVLIITTYDSEADVLRCMEAGAIGYVLKDAPRAYLLDAIRAAARGQSVLAPHVATRLVSRLRGGNDESAAPLSPREIEVLNLVAKGSSNKEIAKALHISEATIKTHLIHVFTKLKVDDRTAAVTVALERGILRL